ncbi:hypothetical protein [Catenibacterium sp.]|uniref:hypothetical protein n=1 Tax=Catenibacterium sp. TaxID=2049022 RepID=UPI003079DD55
MELVSGNKLAAVADFLSGIDIDGQTPCQRFNDFLKRDRVNVPCDIGDCEGDCPFYSKENFLKWIKEPNKKREFVDLKKPKIEDFNNDYFEEEKRYIEALEEYCDDLESVLADTEYDLESSECDNRELTEKLEKIRGVLDGKY